MNNSIGDYISDMVLNFLEKELVKYSPESAITESKSVSKENIKNESNRPCPPCPPPTQTHTHEYEQSTKLAEEDEDRHNHRLAGVTSEVIFLHDGTGRHVHGIKDNTDFLDHHHEISVLTDPNIDIPGTNKHFHVVRGTTTFDDQHDHDFLFTTQINAPLV